jgi:hypothetical protein
MKLKAFLTLMTLQFALVIGVMGNDAPTDPPIVGNCTVAPFGTVSVSEDFQANGPAKNNDTIAFWDAPNPNESLMFVSSKSTKVVEVWQYPYTGPRSLVLDHSTFTGGQVNGVLVDQDTDLLYVSVGSPTSAVSVFALPDLNFMQSFDSNQSYQSEPNLGLLNLTSGEKQLYVSADFPVYVHDATSGSFLFQFSPSQGLETLVGDDFYQVLYIPDENNFTGVYAYNPDGSPYLLNGTNQFGFGVFQADAEGIVVWTCDPDDGSGVIIVADQIGSGSEFEFFDRATWSYLGKVLISGVANTDGIALTQQSSAAYPDGVFAAIDNDGAAYGVSWITILNAIGYTPPLPNVPPVSAFSYVANGLSVLMVNESTDSDGMIVAYDWTFAGKTSTLENPIISADSSGTYSACLTVTDDDDATGNFCQDITVSGVITNCDQEIAILQAEIDSLETDLASCNVLLSAAEIEVANLVVINDSLEIEVTNLTLINDSLIVTNDSLQTEITNLEVTVTTLTEDLTAAQALIITLETDVADLTAVIEWYQIKAAELALGPQ